MGSLRRNVRVVGRGPAALLRDRGAGPNVGAFFDEFAPMVLAVCRYHLRDPHAAEDAAQETFLSAHRSMLGGTRPRDPAAWLATIARNECGRTRRTARPAPLDEESAATFLDPADIVADRADLSDVANAIAELPPRQREALVLREFCGLSYEQVAAAMSVSGAAVDSLLSRARRRLIEQLGEIPRAAHGTLVVPASLREELARLIPGLDAAGAAAGAGAGALATLTSLGSAPVAAKVAATCAATVVLAVPMQATLRADEGPRASVRTHAAAGGAGRERPAATPERWVRPASFGAEADDREERSDDSSGHGSGGSGSSSSGSGSSGSDSGSSGSGSSGSGSSGSGSDSGGSESSGSGSSGSDSGSSGSGSSGSGSSRSGSDSSGSGSGSSGSGSSGSGSSGSGSGSSGSGSSGSGSDSSGSESGLSGSASSGSGSSGSGSSGSGSSGSGSSDSGSSGSGSSGSDSGSSDSDSSGSESTGSESSGSGSSGSGSSGSSSDSSSSGTTGSGSGSSDH